MKFFSIAAVMAILLSSCLKESIPDAMLAAKDAGIIKATMSYKVNGEPVSISLKNADQQDPNSYYYTLLCIKSGNSYGLAGRSATGELDFNFYTDSLTTGNYKYTGAYVALFAITYNETYGYVYATTDSMSFNVTSYNDGLISGNFSGAVSPMTAGGTNILGTPSSIIVTDGSFQNVPVFY
jgi:hypothetical protein